VTHPFKAAQNVCVQVFSALVLTACSSVFPGKQTPAAAPTLDAWMTQAAQFEKSGQKEKAFSQYAEAARQYPAAKQPWLQMAQMRFDQNQNGEAILAAQQALARDSQDTKALSILTVSGLRVSSRALSELMQQRAISGSDRATSKTLVEEMRGRLGIDNLVIDPTGPRPPGRRPSSSGTGVITKPARSPTTAPSATSLCKPEDIVCVLNKK
jgi:tetratricopeptide (TPR) repeat protein